jgi:hypothetical protein
MTLDHKEILLAELLYLIEELFQGNSGSGLEKRD